MGALLTAACSGGREDPLGGDCISDRQCPTSSLCILGTCMNPDDPNATARIAGAPADTRVETRGDDNSCEDRGEEGGLVCVLGSDDGLTLIAPAVEGYRFTHWSGSAACKGEDPELALQKLKKSVSCTANYVKRIVVRGEIAGEGGAAIVASSEAAFAVCELGQCEVDVGSEVVLLAPARDGFRLNDFEGAGCELREGYRVTVASEEDVLCTASYVDSLTVRGQTSGLPERAAEVQASSSWEGALCDGPLCAVDPGQTVELTAPVVEGFRFRGWLGGPACLGSEPVLTVENVTSSVSCTADYVARFVVRGVSEGADAPILASAENLFAACDGASCVVDSGEAVTLIAGVVEGYRLLGWSGEGCEAQAGAAVLAANVQRETTCTARYVEGVSVSGTLVNAVGVILASSDTAGAACEPGSCAIDIGGSVTLSAPNLDGRTFLGWSGSEGCTGNELTITLRDVRTSKACNATYAARYTVSGVARGGGSVSASAAASNAKCSGSRCEVDEGSPVTLVAQANADFRFTGWTGGGPCTGVELSLVVPNVRSSVSCTANFVERIDVSGVAAPAAAGRVQASQLSLNAVCSANKCTVDAGSDVTLNAIASPGYTFVSWSGCGGPFNPFLGLNPLPVLGASADTVCTANFEELRYPVTALGSTGGTATAAQATVCPGGVCQVPYGESATLTALPDDGYDFVGWTGGCSGGASTTVANVTAAVTCTATFTIKRVTLSASSSNGGPAPRTSCGGASCTVDWGSSVTVTAVIDPTRYRFDGWSCPGGVASGEVITVTNLRANQGCIANYTRRNLVTVVAGANGTAGCVGSCWVDPGGSVAVQATADGGYSLYGWACGNEAANPPPGSVQTNNPRTVTPAGDLTCSATFGPILY
ncbi:MAG TPA: hypothetical protein VFX59_20575 [Polyangiales bacterium]|nr:hypothetical protein [Polyangiales bacterium]